MAELLDIRRYLTDFDSTRTGNALTDVLVIGSGVAGARAALEAAESGPVVMLTKGDLQDSTTRHAQGGVAAALDSGDSAERHAADTIRAGCGLNDPLAVEILVTNGPSCIKELADWGLPIDRCGSVPALTREGGHSLNRVVHAHGDRTGEALVGTLTERIAASANIRVFEHCFLIDLVTTEGVCRGAVTFHRSHGHQLIWAKQTILASGGCGQLWRETTNPPMATGDGLAAAYRAGAALRNMDLMQFHPTTLYVAGAGRALISEAVRGEGAYLVDRAGDRFMPGYHPEAELASRDVVSQAIVEHIRVTNSNCVFLDVRHMSGFADRFPQIAKLCADFDIDVTRDLIPVRPSAHYMIGGVEAGVDGTTSVEGLLCCGEAASTGVHGANRLASNSLLEGLVFGKLAGQTAVRRGAELPQAAPVRDAVSKNPESARTELDLADICHSLRSVMWRNVGIVRSGERLAETCDILKFWERFTLDKTFDDRTGWETQNKLAVARLVAMSALERTESLGVHCRSDSSDGPVAPYNVRVARQARGTVPERVPAAPTTA